MIALLCFFLTLVASPFKSKSRLEAENAALRHQVIVLQRSMSGRVQLTNGDRLFLVMLYRWFPSVLKAITIIRPETLVRWHRTGFRRYWRWKSRSLGGRPKVEAELRALIRRMSAENPLWGAPRIHGELLKLGFEVGQSSVAKYMVKRWGPPSQGWRTFLRNHAPDIGAMDLFVVPTIGFPARIGQPGRRAECKMNRHGNESSSVVKARANPSASRAPALPSTVPTITSNVVFPIASATSTGCSRGAARQRSTCRIAIVLNVGTKASSLSCRKVGATARRCHFQSAPSAMNNEAGPSIGDNSCRATSSLRKRCARATRMSWISSGSLTSTESKNRARYRTKPCSSYSARG